jgi:hypothetical protein
MDLEEQIQKLEEQFKLAEKDVVADMGEEAWESGGWVEIAYNIASLGGPEISLEAKREFLRCQGVTASPVSAWDHSIFPKTDDEPEDWLSHG